MIGTVHFAVDPAHPSNQAIVDIDKAPRDSDGRVIFSADLYALIPKDAARRNGIALLDVLNRGRKNILRDFNRAPPVADAASEADFGDGFLMRRGFSLVWVGWQFDVPRRAGLMGWDAPRTDRGRPITGRVSTTFVPNTADPTLSARRHGALCRYHPLPAARPGEPESRLTVRTAGARARHPARLMAVRPRARRARSCRHVRVVLRSGLCLTRLRAELPGAESPSPAWDFALRDLAAGIEAPGGRAAAHALRLGVRPIAGRALSRSFSTRASTPTSRAGRHSTVSSPTSPDPRAATTSTRALRGLMALDSSRRRCFHFWIGSNAIRRPAGATGP